MIEGKSDKEFGGAYSFGVPGVLKGRVGGTLDVLGSATLPLDALLAEARGQWVGLHPIPMLAALLEAATALWMWWSPLLALRTVEVRQAEE